MAISTSDSNAIVKVEAESCNVEHGKNDNCLKSVAAGAPPSCSLEKPSKSKKCVVKAVDKGDDLLHW